MFSNTFEYAVRAAVNLASVEGSSASAERIAECTQVPPGYISKVMRDLVVAGLVESQRGPNGGFRLARAASKISMLDIMNAVAPMARIAGCPLGIAAHVNLCPLHRRLDDAIASVEKAFAATSLAELIEQPVAGEKRCKALTQKATVSAPRTAKARRK
ncbi:MAG: Rrf2 family transcriptional regulator [Phycisphaerae bacterium]|nr:Rrf2 family transcriptional regulator [Phycisphaerae bacterium]